jgi:hypothetical protein
MARRKGRRSLGSMRQLPSGGWQARYRDLAGVQHTAPQTFATRPEAARFLAQVETDLARASGPIHALVGCRSRVDRPLAGDDHQATKET